MFCVGEAMDLTDTWNGDEELQCRCWEDVELGKLCVPRPSVAHSLHVLLQFACRNTWKHARQKEIGDSDRATESGQTVSMNTKTRPDAGIVVHFLENGRRLELCRLSLVAERLSAKLLFKETV